MKGLWLILVPSFVGSLVISNLRLTVILLLTDLQTSLIEIGIVTAAHSVTTALLSIPWGLASDRVGRRVIVMVGFAIILVSSLFLLVARDVLSIFAAFVLMAGGWAAVEPSISASVGDIAEPTKLARAYASYSATLLTGFSSGPAIAGTITTLFGFNVSFLFASLMIFPALLPIHFAKELRGKLTVDRVGMMKKLRSLCTRRTILAGWSTMIFSFLISGAFETFVPVNGRVMGLEPWFIGLLLSSYYILGLITRLPVGWMLDKVRNKTFAVSLGLLTDSIGLALVPLFTDPLPLLIVIAIMGFSRSATYTGAMAMVASGCEPSERGLALGMVATLRHAGITISPILFSVGASSMGIQFGFFTVALGASTGSLVLLFLGRGFAKSAKNTSYTS